MTQRMLTTKQAAEMCGVTPQTLKKWVGAAGYNLPRQGRGRHELRFPQELVLDVMRYRQNRRERIWMME